MLTGTRPALFWALMVLLSAPCVLKAQEEKTDTVNIKPFERYWTKPRIVPRIGGGVQESAFVEVGVAWHKIYVHPLALASTSPYFSIDGIVKDGDPIIGPKIGYELTAGLIGLAADVTYYTDFEKKSLVLTPKAGLSLLGFANLFYGYNIPLSDHTFGIIDRNRFSIVFNINRDYFNLKSAEKRPHKNAN
jgi:hypothetical protein